MRRLRTAALSLVLLATTGVALSAPVPYGELVRRSGPHGPARRIKPKPPARPRRVGTTPGVAARPVAATARPSGPPPAAGPPQPPPAAVAPPHPAAAPTFTAPTAPPPPPELPSAAPLGAVVPAGARLAPGAAPPAAELEAFVDGAVRQAMTADHVAGVAVAVVQNGEVVLERGYGLARLSPATPVDPRSTLFRLGSVSKLLTWIEVLKAVEAGRLRLKQPVNERLPPALKIPDDGFRTPIRLRNLLVHDEGFEAREFGRLYRTDAGALRPLAAALEADRPRRVRAPGEMPTYQSYGAALAGFMAADAARTPFETLLERDLLRPAGMDSTTFGEPRPQRDGLPAPMPGALAARLAQGHAWTAAGLRPLPYGFGSALAPALSASSTADDMARLMLALLADGRASGAGALLWGPRTNAALRTPLAPGWTYGPMLYALPGGFRGFGHEGSAPGFQAKLMVAPQLGLGVFVAADTDTAARLVHALPELVVRRFYAGPATASAGPPVERADYDGLYVSTRRTYHGLEGFVGRLTRLWRVRTEPGGAAVVVWGPDGGRRWLSADGRGGFTAADDTGEPLRFLRDARGRARAFLDPGGMWGAERVDGLHQPGVLAAATGLAEAAALLTLAGLVVRPRDYRQSRRQTSASRLQSLTAVLWLAALAAFTVFAGRDAGAGGPLRRWPDPWLVGASSCALAAGLLTLAQLAQLPGAWTVERRVHGWGAGRKLRHTVTVLAFAAFSFVLLGWGALEPWSS